MNTTKQCAFCKEDILNDATVCKHCSKKQPPVVSKLTKRLFQGILVMIGIGIFISIISPDQEIASDTNKTVTANWLKTGEDGYVSVEGSDTVLIATTKEYYDEMFKLLTIKDTLGVSQMVLDGKVLLADKGTSVKVIGSTMASREVRITEGKYIGKSGWVPSEMVLRK